MTDAGHPSRPHAVITGASAGLGREFARQLAEQGYDVTLVSRDAGRLRELAEAIRRTHAVHARVIAADLTLDADVTRVLQELEDSDVDILVNNAGMGHSGRVGITDHEQQDRMVRLHVLAVHRLTQGILPGMLRRRSGAVVLVSSVASFLTSAGNVNYCATKAYARLFAEGLARETEQHGVYVQALCPGFTHTEFHERAGMAKRAPAWMWMRAADVVAASLAAVRRRGPTVVIPGLGYRMVAFGLRYSPRWLQAVEARVYRRR